MQAKKFGEENCFNENNELRKLMVVLGVEIGPKSVVADVINLQLQVMQIQSAPILEAANRAVPEIMKLVGPGMTIDPKRPDAVRNFVLGPYVTGAPAAAKRVERVFNEAF